MPLSPQGLTLAALFSKDGELSECSTDLSHSITGNSQTDAPIELELQQIYAERAALAARRNAIINSGTFTPPTDAQVSALQNAIVAVHKAIMASSNATVVIGLTTTLLQQYGASQSK